ncbi:MAG: hypothetical protein IJ147_03000 [Lachnospiraceae bacterium]|nr:hypothetical protein [Lachnospiraceae bacterium]
MSFVYASRSEKDFFIVADTKVKTNDVADKSWKPEVVHNVKKFGIIKNVILSPDIVLGFAGNKSTYANSLVEFYYQKKPSLDDFIKRALCIHRAAAENDIEFIIAYWSVKKQNLVCIKNNRIYDNLPYAWIGSDRIYYSFEKAFYDKYPDGKADNLAVKQMVTDIMDSGVDDTVGRYIITAQYDLGDDSFHYREKYSINSAIIDLSIKPGECIKFVQCTERGSYFYHIYESKEIVAIYVDELRGGIVYQQNPFAEVVTGMEYMRLPHMIRMSKIEFDKYIAQYGAWRTIDMM